jgi:ArsR family transcriptional regulator
MKCHQKINLQELSDSLSIISQPNRLQIICLLKNGELCVCKIIEALQLKQNLISHHLNLLKKIWLVTSRRDGKNIFYKLNTKNIQNIQLWLSQIINS